MKLGRYRRFLLLASLVMAGTLGVLGYVRWRESRFDALIRGAAERNNLDYHLVKALIHEESWYDPSVRGKDGELGLMQITPPVRTEYMTSRQDPLTTEPDLLNPAENLEVGCWYLRQSLNLYQEYDDPLPMALARYNAGESRVKAWIRKIESPSNREGLSEEKFLASIDIPSTRSYVNRVLKRYRARRPSNS